MISIPSHTAPRYSEGVSKARCGYVHERCDFSVRPTGVHRHGMETVERVPVFWKAPDAWNSSSKVAGSNPAPATTEVAKTKRVGRKNRPARLAVYEGTMKFFDRQGPETTGAADVPGATDGQGGAGRG